MHGAEYQSAALRTENQDFEAIKLRLSKPQLVWLLLNALYRFLSISADLDKIKKHLFYGKDLDCGLSGISITEESAETLFKKLLSNDVTAIANLRKHDVLRKLHAVLGVATESGELAEMLLNLVTLDSSYDDLSWIKEWGDVVWYAAEGASSVSSDLDTVFAENIKKLKVRYPDLFSETLAQNHDGA
jgi:hypothetical protein